MNENERFETLKSMTQDIKEKMDKEAFRLYPTFVQDREIFRRGVEWGMNAVIGKAVKFLESTDFCKYYNQEFIEEFRRKMEE